MKTKQITFHKKDGSTYQGTWKDGKEDGLGKYMYWIIKNDGYSEAQYFSGRLLEIREKFSKEFREYDFEII